jgi:hypothetical protein
MNKKKALSKTQRFPITTISKNPSEIGKENIPAASP